MATRALALLVLATVAATWAVFQVSALWDKGSWFQPVDAGAQVCGLLDAKEFTLYSQHVVTPDGVKPASVHVKGGMIQSVTPSSTSPPEGLYPVLDYGSSVIMPGLIDAHVHMNEPGRTDWEGMETGTRAAAAGGFSAVVDMPLNNLPITTTPEALQAKLDAIKGKLSVDVGFWGGLTPENARNETALAALFEAGVRGAKCFTCPSGSEFPQVTVEEIKSALPVFGRYGLPLLVHALLPQPEPEPTGSPQEYVTYLKTKPPSWEKAAISALIDAARSSPEAARARIHVVHLSDAESLPMIAAARESGVNLTVETCAHYLTFAAEDIPDKHTEYKCDPPIRYAANRDKLWEGLLSGGIDYLASDHSPCPPELKFLEEGDYLKAWGGISSVQFGLSATWTLAKDRGATLEDIARWWSSTPAKLANLENKGSIAAGKDADFVVWDPEGVHTVTKDTIDFKHKVTPYVGMQLTGNVEHTFVRGQLVYSHGKFADPVCGKPRLGEKLDMVSQGPLSTIRRASL